MSNETAFQILRDLSPASKMSAPMQAHYLDELMKALKYEQKNKDISPSPPKTGRGDYWIIKDN